MQRLLTALEYLSASLHEEQAYRDAREAHEQHTDAPCAFCAATKPSIARLARAKKALFEAWL